MDSKSPVSIENSIDSPAGPAWMKRVPLVTGVLAGLAGFLTVRSANMSNLANYNSTQAVLHQAQASDAWNEYEANSVKRHGDENALLIGGIDEATKEKLKKEAADFKARQDKEMPRAALEEKLRDSELFDGQKKLQIKDLLDYAGVAAQLGIALASVAALTRRKIAYHFGLFAGVVAILVTGYAVVEPIVSRWLTAHY